MSEAQMPQHDGERAAEWTQTRGERWLSRALARVTGSVLGPYQTAVVRIGFGTTWLFFLLREWPHRRRLYGPDSTWSFELGERLLDSNHAFSVLMWSSSQLWFELVYHLAILASVALLLGWRTRMSSVFFMVGVLSLQNRSIFMGDGGDNVIHLMAIYLVFTRCARVWSLDARRARRCADGGPSFGATGPVLWAVCGAVLLGGTFSGGFSLGWGLLFWGLWLAQGAWWLLTRTAATTGNTEGRDLMDVVANVLHNGALLVIMVEVCLIYSTAGWYKIQGSRWQDGTAVYYPMHLDYFSPWPGLSEVLAGNGLMIMVVTYGTVLTQVAFPFTLLNRRAKNALLALMIVEHLGIAVLLGLPFFSLAMIAADIVFLPTALLLWTGARTDALRRRLTRRPDPEAPRRLPRPRSADAPAPDSAPAPHADRARR
ncbi:HTTM domain-containing protein [Streptomyces xiaopingdaonensis]|uniref:HTTM domain-containing protein n=1 Tax=Streptomyces xiaopingdaonensis TaxID=1565415 RepID=UPI00031F8F41